MKEPGSTQPATREPRPPDGHGVHRRAPRAPGALHDEHPTPARGRRFVLACLIIGLAAIVMFILPAALWLAGRLHWLRWQWDFAALELLGLAVGVVLLSVVYALDPFPHRRRTRKPKPGEHAS